MRMTTVTLVGNAGGHPHARDLATYIPARYPPCFLRADVRKSEGEGEELESADRCVPAHRDRWPCARTRSCRGRVGRAKDKGKTDLLVRTRLRCSLSVSEPAVPLARIDVLCRLISVLALAFTMTSVLDLGGRAWENGERTSDTLIYMHM